MAVTDADEARVIRLLSHDVAATLGPGYERLIRDAAAQVRTFRNDPASYVEQVVEFIQQDFHDSFIDTTWPACPLHPNHPLWLHGEHWLCELTQRSVASLGALSGDSDLGQPAES